MAPVNKIAEESSFDEEFALEIDENEYDPAEPDYYAATTSKPPAVIYEASYESAPEPKKRRLTASGGGKTAPSLSKDETKRQQKYAEKTVNIARARKINENVLHAAWCSLSRLRVDGLDQPQTRSSWIR